MFSFSIVIVPLIIGYLLDLIFGDPRKLPHPIVAFGNIIGWCERHFNKGGHKKRNGCLIAIILPQKAEKIHLVFAACSAFRRGRCPHRPARYMMIPAVNGGPMWASAPTHQKQPPSLLAMKSSDFMPVNKKGTCFLWQKKHPPTVPSTARPTPM